MSHERPTVLIIDDENYIHDRLTQLLGCEFNCYTARTGKDGLELFRKIADEHPLVVCDVDLPDIVGFDVCKSIKSTHPRTYVMLLTGYNSKIVRMKGLYSFADICLDKTLDDAEIRLLIRNAYNTMQPRAFIAQPLTQNNNSAVRPSDLETKIQQYITSYYKKPTSERNKNELSLIEISAYFHMNQRTFQRKIKDLASCSYIKYLTQIKLEKSKDFLAEEFTITEISELLEYSSPSHYSREFKKYTGLTPNKYKKINGRLC